jgi:hypothetical protein
MKVIKVQKKQGKKDTYWATIEYTKEELEKEFPSIEYDKAGDEYLLKFDEISKAWTTSPPLV